MYINFDKLNSFLKEFDLEDLFYLLAVKQKDQENIEKYHSEKIANSDYVKSLKSGEKRIDKKGEKLLKDLSSSSKVTEEIKTISDWIYKNFKDREGGIVKSKLELERRLLWFSEQTGWQKNKLALLISTFIMNTYSKESGLSIEEAKKENPRMVLNNIAENMLWTPPNHFSRIYKLEESPLNRFYEDNEEYIEQIWKQNNIE